MQRNERWPNMQRSERRRGRAGNAAFWKESRGHPRQLLLYSMRYNRLRPTHKVVHAHATFWRVYDNSTSPAVGNRISIASGAQFAGSSAAAYSAEYEPMTTKIQDERSQPQSSDEELLLSYRDSGDHATFALLVHRYEREIYNYLARYLRNPHLAQESYQATYLPLHQKSHLIAEDRRVRPWLYSIATSQAVDLLRREGRHQAISLDQRRQAARGTEEADALAERLEAGGPDRSTSWNRTSGANGLGGPWTSCPITFGPSS
jgi:hypothetical protein